MRSVGDVAGGLLLDAPATVDDEPRREPLGRRVPTAGGSGARRPISRVGRGRRSSSWPHWRRSPTAGAAARATRDVLRRGCPQHVAELAQLLLRRLRPLGDGLGRQVARSLLGPGALRPPLRLPHLGHGAASGRRGDADRPRPLPRRPPRRRRRGGTRRRARAGHHAGHHPVEPGQHLGLAAHSAARAGGGLPRRPPS